MALAGTDHSDFSALRRRIIQWYRRHARVLPWRNQHDSWAVLVSEFMLQQTQASRVAAKFDAWMTRFPDVHTLARARRCDVLLAWSGFGYNRRAISLHECARVIVRDHGGTIPADPAVLITLPGIGRYTAHAVACFAHGCTVPVVDVNIRRVLSRVLMVQNRERDMMAESDAWMHAVRLLPRRNGSLWNQALMEFGAVVCTARRPQCDACPLARSCPSHGRLEPAERAGAAGPRIVPRRIHRGRVVEMLRRMPGHAATPEDIARHLHPDAAGMREDRLLDILTSLERDGMVRLSRRSADAGGGIMRVRLA